jgi:molybdate transport system substrate-binding protein
MNRRSLLATAFILFGSLLFHPKLAFAEQSVSVFAASSTQNFVDKIADAFQKSEGVKVRRNYSSSGSLARQLLSGAKADLFLSANTEWTSELKKQNLISEQKSYLSNQLVVIAPKGSNFPFGDIQQLKVADRIAIADPMGVPAGMYAKQALEYYGLWESVSRKLIAGSNVRVSLLHVELKEAPLGIVYLTDASISDLVQVLHKIPPEAHSPIEYPLFLMNSASPAGEKLYQFFQRSDAIVAARKLGFKEL